MSKDKQRPHELKDASAVETYWIEPMHEVNTQVDNPESKVKKNNTRKPTEMRENKATHQHTYGHEHDYRKSESNDNL